MSSVVLSFIRAFYYLPNVQNVIASVGRGREKVGQLASKHRRRKPISTPRYSLPIIILARVTLLTHNLRSRCTDRARNSLPTLHLLPSKRLESMETISKT